VIGAVLTARQSVLLTTGDTPTDAFVGGYQAGLLLAAGFVALGAWPRSSDFAKPEQETPQ